MILKHVNKMKKLMDKLNNNCQNVDMPFYDQISINVLDLLFNSTTKRCH